MTDIMQKNTEFLIENVWISTGNLLKYVAQSLIKAPDIASDNGLVASGSKPLPKAMLSTFYNNILRLHKTSFTEWRNCMHISSRALTITKKCNRLTVQP